MFLIVNFNCLFILTSFTSLFQALTALLADDNKFGFIVMDGNGALFGTLSGNTREVLHKFTVDLPKKHGKCIEYSFYVGHFKSYLCINILQVISPSDRQL